MKICYPTLALVLPIVAEGLLPYINSSITLSFILHQHYPWLSHQLCPCTPVQHALQVQSVKCRICMAENKLVLVGQPYQWIKFVTPTFPKSDNGYFQHKSYWTHIWSGKKNHGLPCQTDKWNFMCYQRGQNPPNQKCPRLNVRFC